MLAHLHLFFFLPTAAAVTFLALVFSVFTTHHHRRTSHPSYVASPSRSRRLASHHIPTTALVLTLLAALFTTIAFALDRVFVDKARDAAHDTDGLIKVSDGPVSWMTLAAMILLWIAAGGAYRSVMLERRRVARASGGGARY
jgi:hypothetical protein